MGPAQAIGGAAAGCLKGGAALPAEGKGFQTIRLSRNRHYGHPELIDYVQDVGAKAAAAGLGTVLVADLNQPRGGPMPWGHASHQNGLDVDFWLRLDLPPMSRSARETVEEINYVDYDRGRVRADVWSDRQARFIRIAAEDARVNRIFVHPAIKLALCRKDWDQRAWLAKVRPWYGHDGHMHVRLNCPAGSPECVDQRPFPPGEGCDDDLHNWIRDANRPITPIPPEKARPPRPELPKACAAVLNAPAGSLAAAR